MSKSLLSAKLIKFRDYKQVFNVGALGTVLVITRRSKKMAFPIKLDKLITPGGGQVAGLSGRSINKILSDYGISSQVGTESGRTSRGTPSLARSYAEFLNGLASEKIVDLDEIEHWWIARFIEYFNTEPFKLNYDQSKTLVSILRNLLDQALDRQRKSPGKTYVGAVLQHLVGAKLELSLADVEIIHNGFSVADAVSFRSGDFVIDNTVIHCTTAPSEALLQKCKLNLHSGKTPIILTISKMLGAAEGLAEAAGIDGRVEIMDTLQFIAANLYEMSLFDAAQRKITIDNLIDKYNEIVSKHESDASLRIEIG